MKKISKLIVGVFCALLLATSAYAADTAVKASTNAPVAVTTTPAPASDWIATLGGSGATTTSGDSQSQIGLNFSLGKQVQIGLPTEIGVRQYISYSSDPNTTLAATKLYADAKVLTFNLSDKLPVDVLVGVNGGPTYGNTTLRWTVAPEAAIDIWLAKNVAIDARVEFPFNLNGDNTGFDNVFGYTIGVKFKF